jgi:hypothetical protein
MCATELQGNREWLRARSLRSQPDLEVMRVCCLRDDNEVSGLLDLSGYRYSLLVPWNLDLITRTLAC